MNAVSYAIFRSATSVYEAEKGNSLLQFEQFLPVIVRAHPKVWTGWDMVVHHDDEVEKLPYFQVLRRLQEAGRLNLVFVRRAADVGLCRAMLWRMRPVFGSEYEHVVCRDVDSIPSVVDAQIVREWIGSEKTLHVIHDNPAHGGIMGGTLGVRCAAFRSALPTPYGNSWADFEDLLSRTFSREQWNRHGADQDFLNVYVAPLVGDNLLLHTSNGVDPKRMHSGVEVRAIVQKSAIGVCDWPARHLGAFPSEEIDRIERECRVRVRPTPDECLEITRE